MCIHFICMMTVIAHPASSNSPSREDLQEAVRDLDHEQYKVRIAAARKLLSAGKAAIEPLVKAARTGSAETADRAVKILQDLAFNSNEETMMLGREAMRKLAASNSPVRDVVQAILQQQRGKVMDRMQEAGVIFQMEDDRVRAIYLDRVENLAEQLPLLREFPELTEISISNKKFGDAQMKNLLPLKRLKWLNLFQSSIGDEALKQLKNFPALESLPIGGTKITDAGLVQIGELTQLEYLGLRGNRITDAGLIHLKKMTSLTGLTLQETKVTDGGLEHLQALKKMEHLRMQKTAITDAGLEKLKGLKSLRRIDAADTQVTPAGAEKLQEAIPGLTVATHENQ